MGHVNDCSGVGIGSTAAVSGTVLSVGGGEITLSTAWTRIRARSILRNDMNNGPSAFAWESPLLAYGRAYLGIASNCDGPSVRGEVRAVDINTGQQLANQYFVPAGNGGAGVWNSPVLSPDGNTLVVATGEDFGDYDGPYNRALISLDPITLAIRQVYKVGQPHRDEDWGTTPVFFHDNQGRTLVGAQSKNGTLYVFEVNSIQNGPIWTLNTDLSVGLPPAYDPNYGPGGTLFVTGNRHIFAFDPATGNERWPNVVTYPIYSNIVIANSLGPYANLRPRRRQILNEYTGDILTHLHPRKRGGGLTPGLAVANGMVYVLSGAYLNAWGLPVVLRYQYSNCLWHSTNCCSHAHGHPTNFYPNEYRDLPVSCPQIRLRRI